MEDNRIQNQIAIYMTNKKLCEFTDKLKPAPIEYYAHMHAQGEEQADGIRAYSCIGVVLQDYSNGKLLYEMAVDIMEEGGHDLNPVEASALERAEVARRLNVYLEQLPEYQDRISFVFERK